MAEMKFPKALVPKSKIPQVNPVCHVCEGPTKPVLSTAHATGYHRRHKCCDPACNTSFYSLADYHSKEVKYSPVPFKDRALTELEMLERDMWWEEEANYVITLEVTPWDLPHRMRQALDKEVSKRDAIDKYIVEKHHEMLEYIKNLTAMELMDD